MKNQCITCFLFLAIWSLFASATAVAGENYTFCTDDPRIRQIAGFKNVYLGEFHGTIEAPKVVGCVLAEKLKKAKNPILVSIELPAWNSTDGVEHWKRYQDGKTSIAMWELMQFLLEKEAKGLIRIHYQYSPNTVSQTVKGGQSAYEKAVADELTSLSKNYELLIYGGAFHSQKSVAKQLPNITPAGAYLGDLVQHIFLAADMGGEGWACKGSLDCGIVPLQTLDVDHTKTDVLIEDKVFNHDYLFLLGRTTVSMPKNSISKPQ